MGITSLGCFDHERWLLLCSNRCACVNRPKAPMIHINGSCENWSDISEVALLLLRRHSGNYVSFKNQKWWMEKNIQNDMKWVWITSDQIVWHCKKLMRKNLIAAKEKYMWNSHLIMSATFLTFDKCFIYFIRLWEIYFASPFHLHVDIKVTMKRNFWFTIFPVSWKTNRVGLHHVALP